MKVLLTGGSGQVGTEVRRRLLDVDLIAPSRAEFDLSKPEELGAKLAEWLPDLVLSVGAYTAVDRAEEEPEIAMAANGHSVGELAKYCDKRSVPLIHLSTDYVFDGSKAEPYLPGDLPRPLGVYGASKLAGEVAARSAAQHLILRVSWVFSAHGSNFVKTMLRVGASGKSLRIVDDQFGGPTWAGHIAEAITALVHECRQGKPLPWGTYHFSGTPYVSWFDFANEIFRQALSENILNQAPETQPIATEDYPTKAHRPKNSCLNMPESICDLRLSQPDWRVGLRATLVNIRDQ